MALEPQPAEVQRLGVISITSTALAGISPAVTIDVCSTQGELRDQGVLQALHDFLLLPESYTINAMFYGRRDWHIWELLVESAELPEVDADSAADLPRVEPIYCIAYADEHDQLPEENSLRSGKPFRIGGSLRLQQAHLVEIKVIPPIKTIPVSGGIEWLIKASVAQALGDREKCDEHPSKP